MNKLQYFSFFNRGSSPAARLTFFSVLSLLLLFVDAHYPYLESARSVLSILNYPLQRLAAAPATLFHQADEYFTLQNKLRHDNIQLRQQHSINAVQLQQLQVLQIENQHLRELLAIMQHAAYPMQLAEIAYGERDVFKRKIFLNKGSMSNVQAGQVVMDNNGVVGQITRVFPWISEVTLLTDKDHAVPVQVMRNGLRTVVFGSGDTGALSLRYMPNSADIHEGDVLITSGIDGIYPPGLQVARVDHIERDPAYPFERIQCSPLAGVDNQRQLLILSGIPEMPEQPESVTETGLDRTKHGKKRKP